MARLVARQMQWNEQKWNEVIIWFDPMNIIFNFFIRLYPFLPFLFVFVFIVTILVIFSLSLSFVFPRCFLQMDALCLNCCKNNFMCFFFCHRWKWYEKRRRRRKKQNQLDKIKFSHSGLRSIVWTWCCIVIYTRDVRCVHGIWQSICANSDRTQHTHTHPNVNICCKGKKDDNKLT